MGMVQVWMQISYVLLLMGALVTILLPFVLKSRSEYSKGEKRNNK